MAKLRLPEPYAFELSTARYRAFGTDLANLWHGGGLHRVIDGHEVRIGAAKGGVDVEPLDAAIEPVVRKLLGAEFDLDSFYGFAQHDPIIASLVQDLRGLRPPIAVEPFESLVTSITAQQVSLHAAFAIRNRLIEHFGIRAEHAFSFPTRERLAVAEPVELFGLGFSRRKAEYVVGLARGDLDLAALAALPDDEVKAQLTALPGIGEWTADWFLARHLARANAWPAGDLGVRKAVSRFYGEGRNLTTEEVREIGERFDPFQNLTAHYLLAGLLRDT
ncbi:MAG: DNA-3-methyladenine glycosylase 2 family protein [Actinobacteria bacterium]|nr:MAG: DNA-3-methyladenine glycosylase 2 family protein [Actinomycetota bacterium]